MIPTAKDISPTAGLDLDEKCALEHFLGLDRQAVLKLFREESDFLHVYLGDFVHMGRLAFNYYLPPLLQYLDELPDEDFIDNAPDVVAYLLIRFHENEAIPMEIIEYISSMHQRLKRISIEPISTMPSRVARLFSKYEEAKAGDGAPNQPPDQF